MEKMRNNPNFLAILVALAYLCVGTKGWAQSLDVEQQLRYCHRQVERTLKELGASKDYTMTPRNIGANEHHWNLRSVKTPEEWCAGFFPGILWMDGDTAEAAKFTQELEYLAYTPIYDHDLGFIMIGSFLKGYETTHNEHYKEVLLAAADSLATLFNPRVGTLLSWPRNVEMFGGHNTIMDNMINLELLFFSGKKENYDIAVSHADTTMRYHFRPDHTINHVAVYDPVTGKHLYNCTHQGFGDNTLWSRGQAWAIYGYTMVYRYTHEERFLHFAQQVTEAYLSRLPADRIPWWDMGDPMIPHSFRDASAAAVVASGLVELAQYVDAATAERYLTEARQMLATLSSADYQSREKNPAFLLHSVGNMPAGSEVDASINYADYYYLEALQRLKKWGEQELRSPDGRYVVCIGKGMRWHLTYRDKTVVEESQMGVKVDNRLFESALGVPRGNNDDWCSDFVLKGVERMEVDTVWTPLYGENAHVRDRYRQMVLHYEKGTQGDMADGAYDKRKYYAMDIVVRAYDEGVAFRYHFPETVNSLFLHVVGEQTTFAMPRGTQAWYEEWAQGAYEQRSLAEAGWLECERPLLMQLADGTYVALLEAAMKDYARGKFTLLADDVLQMKLYGDVDLISPYDTPWRVVMVGDWAIDLVNHKDLVLNLNEPCKLETTDFIRPGKAFRSGQLNRESILQSIDFCTSFGMQYVELDAGWYGAEGRVESDARTVAETRDFTIPEICAYAREKGVGVWLYVNQRALYRQLNDLLPLYKEWGICGIKFGFVQVGSQQWSTWLHEAVRRCGEYGIMVDIHDEYRPTGLSRAYPHLLTQEGIRGNEEMPDATHNVLLPFTRFLCGPADYTLCYFNNRIKTTHGHQLAMAAAYYSPLQFLFWYDKPNAYRDEQELQFWKEIPTVYDESLALDGEPGQYIVQARRSGNDWYVGAMTNTEARTVVLATDFLASGKYTVDIYNDDQTLTTRTKVSSQTITLRAGTPITLPLQASGGAALHFKLLNETHL